MGQIGLNRSRLVSKPRLITRSTDTSMTTTTTANGALIHLAGLGFEKKNAQQTCSLDVLCLRILRIYSHTTRPLLYHSQVPCTCSVRTQGGRAMCL